MDINQICTNNNSRSIRVTDNAIAFSNAIIDNTLMVCAPDGLRRREDCEWPMFSENVWAHLLSAPLSVPFEFRLQRYPFNRFLIRVSSIFRRLNFVFLASFTLLTPTITCIYILHVCIVCDYFSVVYLYILHKNKGANSP